MAPQIVLLILYMQYSPVVGMLGIATSGNCSDRAARPRAQAPLHRTAPLVIPSRTIDRRIIRYFVFISFNSLFQFFCVAEGRAAPIPRLHALNAWRQRG